MSHLERIGVSLDKSLLETFDELIHQQGYQNRSEAIRDLIRNRLSAEELGNPDASAVAGVFLVYNHHATGLSDKLNAIQHSHLYQVISSIHVHLDHHNCLEIIILKGKIRDISRLSGEMTSLKGVKLGKVNVMTTGEKLP